MPGIWRIGMPSFDVLALTIIGVAVTWEAIARLRAIATTRSAAGV